MLYLLKQKSFLLLIYFLLVLQASSQSIGLKNAQGEDYLFPEGKSLTENRFDSGNDSVVRRFNGFFPYTGQIKKYYAPGTTEYKVQVITTNFTIPLVRFNTVKKGQADNNQKGNVSFFNSVGAGISYNWGRLLVTADENDKEISTEMHNTFGFQLGVLFAVNSNNENSTNIFAPTASLSILNFQLGVGYELGSVDSHENRFFFTIAYGIPIFKLFKGGFYVIKRDDPKENGVGFTN